MASILRQVQIRTPFVAAATAATSAGESDALAIATALLGLLLLAAIGVAAWALALTRRRLTRADDAPAVRALTSAEQRDATIEAELQAMIVITQARARASLDGVDELDYWRNLNAPG